MLVGMHFCHPNHKIWSGVVGFHLLIPPGDGGCYQGIQGIWYHQFTRSRVNTWPPQTQPVMTNGLGGTDRMALLDVVWPMASQDPDKSGSMGWKSIHILLVQWDDLYEIILYVVILTYRFNSCSSSTEDLNEMIRGDVYIKDGSTTKSEVSQSNTSEQ